MKKIVLLAAVLFVALASMAYAGDLCCGGGAPAAGEGQLQAATSEADVGTKCPVCCGDINMESAVNVESTGGTIATYCSKECAEKASNQQLPPVM